LTIVVSMMAMNIAATYTTLTATVSLTCRVCVRSEELAEVISGDQCRKPAACAGGE
jgi:hypothetical protein